MGSDHEPNEPVSFQLFKAIENADGFPPTSISSLYYQMGNNLLLLSAFAALLLSFLLLGPMNYPCTTGRYIASIFLLLYVVFLLLKVLFFSSGQSPTVDLLVWNATIFTSEPSLPFSEAMVVRRGKIISVGNYSSLKVIGDSYTLVID